MSDDTIKLGLEDTHPKTFGFSLTKSGRDFLRQIFLIYLELRKAEGFGYGKVATIVADDSSVNEQEELDSTRQALTRWAGGQSELWLKDIDKTIRVMSRLELEFMRLSELEEILSDQAATIYKQDIGRSLSVFYYGYRADRDERNAVTSQLDNACGIYHIYEEKSENKKTGSFSDSGNLLALVRLEKHSFLLVHEFARAKVPSASAISFSGIKSGYAFPMDDGRIHQLLIDHSRPRRRAIEVLHPSTNDPGRTAQSKQYWVKAELTHDDVIERTRRIGTRVLIPVSRELRGFLANFIEKIMWNIAI